METDAVNDLAHTVRNAVLVMVKRGRDLEDAWTLFEKKLRGCPYAGKNGCVCEALKKADEAGAEDH